MTPRMAIARALMLALVAVAPTVPDDGSALKVQVADAENPKPPATGRTRGSAINADSSRTSVSPSSVMPNSPRARISGLSCSQK